MGPPPKRGQDLIVQGTSMIEHGARRPSTTTMRRSGSIGNLPRATVPAQQRGTCHPLPKEPPPTEQYARSLEQQVQLLELENLFLRRGQQVQPEDTRNMNSCGSILTRGNEVSLNGKDWCRLPEFHPNIEKVIADRMSRAERTADAQQTQIHRGTSARDSDRFSQGGQERERVDTVILQQLEEKNQEVEMLTEQLKEQARQVKHTEEKVAQLHLRLREAESDLSSRSEADTRDKRALVEEMLELQRRLDDLTPTLAEKESRIAKIENERDAVVSKLRLANNEIADLKLKLSEYKKEEQLWDERENAAKQEVIRWKGVIEQEKIDSEEKTRKLEDSLVEIQRLQRNLKEEQMRRSKDSRMMHQINEENSHLISENTRLTTDVAKMEFELGRWKEESARSRNSAEEEKVVELRLNLKAHLTTIGILEERLKAAQSRSEALEAEMAGRWEAEETMQNERNRSQKELEALEALSKSLSNENKSLREEKIQLLDKIDSTRRKMNARDFQIKNLEEEMAEMERRHVEDIRRTEEGSRANSQRALELDELSRRIRELSESLPPDSRRSTISSKSAELHTYTTTTRPEIPLFRSGHPPTIPEEPEYSSCGAELERHVRRT